MQLATSRPWITAGAALAAASIIAVNPVTAPLPVLPDAQAHPVQLTDIASDFTNNVLDPFLGEPVPALQQVIVNEATYLADIWDDVKNVNWVGTDFSSLVNDFTSINFSDPSTIISDLTSALNTTFSQFETDATNYIDAFGPTFSTIGTDITDNATAAIAAPIDIFTPTGSESYLIPSLDTISATLSLKACLVGVCLDPGIAVGGHDELLKWLTSGFPVDIDFGKLGTLNLGNIDILSLAVGSSTAAQILPVLQFIGSPLSGVLWGIAGTVLSPIAALLQDSIAAFSGFTSVFSDFTSALTSATGDLTSVGTDFTNAIDAFTSITSLSDLSTAFTNASTDLGNVGTDFTNAFDAFNPVFTDLGSAFTTAFSDLSNIPGDMFNGFFEGFGNVNNLLADLGLSLPGIVPELDLAGLLSPGGSLFNTLGFDLGISVGDCSIGCIGGDIADPATLDSGPLASLVEMGQAIAQAIGWNDAADQLGNLASLF